MPWPLKHPVYQAAATVPALRRALRRSETDLYGDVEPAAALALSRLL